MMWSSTFVSKALLAVLAVGAVGASAAGVGRVTFTNNQRLLFDVEGNQVDAIGAKVNFFDGKYYLYSYTTVGSSGGPFSATPVVSYSSVDLVNWKYLGNIIDPSNPKEFVLGGGRPHIVYSTKTKKYVLWVNLGTDGYITYTSDFPASGFKVNPRPAKIDAQFTGLQPADHSVGVVDGKGYLAFSVINFLDTRTGSIWPPLYQTLQIAPLTDDLQNTTLPSYNVTSAAFDGIDQQAESPDVFKRNGMFYVVASNTCGWCNGSIGLVYRSTDIKSPWTRQIISGFSCDGQVEGVLPLVNPSTNETTYVWHSSTVPGDARISFNGHIFQPLKFNADGSVQDLNCAPEAKFEVEFPLGEGPPASGRATSATDGSPRLANYEPVCDSNVWALYQTWTNSKAGTLKSLAVNVAANRQIANLTVNVFRYTNDQELISPGYRWEQLAQASIGSATLTSTFNTANIALNATVKKGDKLGFSLEGMDTIPYCHLEFTNTDPSRVLYQKSYSQNSWRGKDGKTNVVYERLKTGIKFFTEVV